MRKINFVKTFVSKGQYKEKEEREGVCIVHLDGVLNEELGAYECVECSMPVGEYSETAVNEAYAAWKTTLTNRGLARAKREVLKKIEAYDTSPAVNGFILNGERVWLDFELRDRVYQGNERLQRIGRTDTTLWLGKQCYNLSIEQAQNIISHIEAYAKDCYNVTAAHKKAVSELTSIEEVEKYDITAGYPAQLKMEV
jgi:hypothetical protein